LAIPVRAAPVLAIPVRNQALKHWSSHCLQIIGRWQRALLQCAMIGECLLYLALTTRHSSIGLPIACRSLGAAAACAAAVCNDWKMPVIPSDNNDNQALKHWSSHHLQIIGRWQRALLQRALIGECLLYLVITTIIRHSSIGLPITCRSLGAAAACAAAACNDWRMPFIPSDNNDNQALKHWSSHHLQIIGRCCSVRCSSVQ